MTRKTGLVLALAGTPSVAFAGTVTNLTSGVGGYTSLASAVSAASAGDVLSLDSGTFTEAGSIAIDKDLVIRGAGSGSTSITATTGSWIVGVLGANVTLEDVRFFATPVSQRAIFGAGGTLTIRDAVLDTAVSTGLDGGAVQALSPDALVLENVVFLGTPGVAAARNGGGLWVNSTAGAVVELTDVTFDGVSALLDGGAIYSEGAVVRCTGCVFDSTSAATYGGAIYADGPLTVTSGRFCGSSAALGGAVYGTDDSQLRNVVFGANDGGSAGSAVYAETGTWTLENDHFLANTGPSAVSAGFSATVVATNNLFLDSEDWALDIGPSPDVTYNWFEGSGVGNVQDVPALDPSNYEDAAYTGALLAGWTGDCVNDDVYPAPVTSPLLDAGDPALSDPDGSASDIGAYGGPSADPAYHLDGDGDGFGFLIDCDDAEAAVAPDQLEVCDLVDNDCDALVDDADPDVADQDDWYPDCDEDGQGDTNGHVTSCRAPLIAACGPGTVWRSIGVDGPNAGGDCDDLDVNVHVGADEVCGATDNDCDGIPSGVDSPVDGTTYYVDGDADNYGYLPVLSCGAVPTYGQSVVGGDCNDASAAVHPTAADPCLDGVDQDCNGFDGVAQVEWWPDVDDDGAGDLFGVPVVACGPPDGYTADASDCDDTDPAVRPGAVEVCNLVDDDCDTNIDDVAEPTTWYEDADGDSYGDPRFPVTDDCPPGDGWTAVGGDCDDEDDQVRPNGVERCNDIDDDCDGAIDAVDDSVQDAVFLWVDFDGDGWGGCPDGLDSCSPERVCAPDGGWADQPGDCNDKNPGQSPTIHEIPGNDIDEDCDGKAQVDATPPDPDKGCNCAASPTTGRGWAAALLAVALIRRRRSHR